MYEVVFLPKAEKDIILKHNCSCSVDVSKFISENYTESYCRYYYRKIIFTEGENEKIIKAISKYLNSTLDDKRTLVEEIHEIKDTLVDYKTEIKELKEKVSYLTKLIAEKNINTKVE